MISVHIMEVSGNYYICIKVVEYETHLILCQNINIGHLFKHVFWEFETMITCVTMIYITDV